MANISTILAKIRENVIDVTSETEARLESFVQEAQRELVAHKWSFSRFTATFTTSEGIALLGAKPANWRSQDGDPFYRTGSGSKVKMEWSPTIHDLYDQHSANTAADYRSAPASLFELAGNILVYPTPDASNSLGFFSADGEYQVLVPYISSHAVLAVTGTTSNPFTDDLDTALYLEEFASGKAMIFNRDFENGQMYLTMARRQFQRAKRVDKQRKIGTLRFTPRRDVYAQRKQRRAI